MEFDPVPVPPKVSAGVGWGGVWGRMQKCKVMGAGMLFMVAGVLSPCVQPFLDIYGQAGKGGDFPSHVQSEG